MQYKFLKSLLLSYVNLDVLSALLMFSDFEFLTKEVKIWCAARFFIVFPADFGSNTVRYTVENAVVINSQLVSVGSPGMGNAEQ